MVQIQDALSSATNVLDIATIIGEAVSYMTEFQQTDEYLFSVLKNYLNLRTDTDHLPDATAQAMERYVWTMDLGALGYSAYSYIKENWLECIVDESGLDALLGAPANALLFAWDIMSEVIPFYSDGLEAVENREISNYAQKMQNDALKNLKYLIAELKESSSISAEDCVRLSECCYVYLKACYIARSTAIKSLDNTSKEFREEIKGKLDVETDINQFAIQYMSVLSSADVENSCYILGFLPEDNAKYLSDCSDAGLLDKVSYSDSALDAAKKQLSSVITYANGKELEEYHFTYNDLGQVSGLVAYRYENGNAIKWYTQAYEYDGNGNLVLVEHNSSQSYHYRYDYDADGRITGYSSIEYYEGSPGLSDTYIFSYDNQDRIVERRNEDGSSVKEFSYDESGKIVYESSDRYWGDGHFVGKTEYDYTYAPLVISTSTSESKEYGNSSSKSISFKPHWNLTVAFATIGDSCSFDVDSSGYLLRIIDANGNNIYVCNYQEALTGNSEYAEWYKRVLQTHPEATTHSYTSSGQNRDFQYDTNYTLYDIDKDGVPELIVQEDLSLYYVYTMSDSGATLCGKFYWTYSDCLYAYDGSGLVVHDGGLGSLHLEYLWLYELSGDVLDSSGYLISTEESPEDELYDQLKKYERITNFIPITDYSMLDNG